MITLTYYFLSAPQAKVECNRLFVVGHTFIGQTHVVSNFMNEQVPDNTSRVYSIFHVIS